jgi:hypothetical protein
MNAAMMLVCLAGSATLGQKADVVFKAPLIEVSRDPDRRGRIFHYVLYNRVYIGRNYDKPKEKADYGNPEKDWSRLPTTYFHDKSPVGVVLQKYNWFAGKDNTYHADARLPANLISMGGDPWGQLVQLWSEPPIAVLGMDIATLAAYARPGQTMHFTERVPTFVKLSFPGKDEKRFFHYAQDARDRGANLEIFEGEPRAMIEKHGGEKFYQVIVIESYKMPVVGVHKELMTREAVQMLMGKLGDDGILCFHTSNRYYQLTPIIASIAKDLKLAYIVGRDNGQYHNDPNSSHRFSSEWVMVARDQTHLGHLKMRSTKELEWSSSERTDKKFIWTDKGEQSFRGLYRSDPDIDKLNDVVNDLREFLEYQVGVSNMTTWKIVRPMQDALRSWSKYSAEMMNRDPPAKTKQVKKSEKN